MHAGRLFVLSVRPSVRPLAFIQSGDRECSYNASERASLYAHSLPHATIETELQYLRGEEITQTDGSRVNQSITDDDGVSHLAKCQ